MKEYLELLSRLKEAAAAFSIATMWRELPIFKEVVSQGKSIIPAIISDLTENGPNWALFDALASISKALPTLTLEEVGVGEKVQKRWLEWAQENGYACCGQALVWTKISNDRQDDHSLEGSRCPVCSTVRERKNRQNIYVRKDSGYACLTCGSEIIGAEVLHPIHDGPFPLSGSGRVKTETVPYCPKCETRPNSSGKIITL